MLQMLFVKDELLMVIINKQKKKNIFYSPKKVILTTDTNKTGKPERASFFFRTCEKN